MLFFIFLRVHRFTGGLHLMWHCKKPTWNVILKISQWLLMLWTWNLSITMKTLWNKFRISYIRIEKLVIEKLTVKLRDFYFLLPSDIMINSNAAVYYVLSVFLKTSSTIIIEIGHCIILTISDGHAKFNLNVVIIAWEKLALKVWCGFSITISA